MAFFMVFKGGGCFKLLPLSVFVFLAVTHKTLGVIWSSNSISQQKLIEGSAHLSDVSNGTEKAEWVFRSAVFFHDNMVLQRGPPGALLWGFGEPEADVWIEFAGSAQRTVLTESGFWEARLPLMRAGGPYSVHLNSTISGSSVTFDLQSLYFGDVWLCSGQSNMEFPVREMFNASEERAAASRYPQIRYMQVALSASPTPVVEPAIQLQWSVPNSASLKDFSAVCWATGRRIHEKLGIPIGLIGSYYGGTPIKAWSSPEAIRHCRHAHKKTHYFAPQSSYDLAGPYDDSALWNAMIWPILSLNLTGVLWYQGEADADTFPKGYLCMFPSMIKSWRDSFQHPNLPFGFVQLGDRNAAEEKIPGGTAVVRYHQTQDFGYAPNKVLGNVFMAVAMDLADPGSPWGSVHPRYKEEIAERLYLGALDVVYQTPTVFQGPFPQSVESKGNLVHINYSSTVSVQKSGSEPGINFEICCPVEGTASWDDCDEWDTVQFSVEGTTVGAIALDARVCEDRSVLFVRYAWQSTPCAYLKCPLYSADLKLPAPPFVLPVL